MRPYRSLRALLVDVPPAYGRILVRAMEEAGWRLRFEHADGPDELLARVLATLGETLGWSCGAAWRPSDDGSELRCAVTWYPASAPPDVAALVS